MAEFVDASCWGRYGSNWEAVEKDATMKACECESCPIGRSRLLPLERGEERDPQQCVGTVAIYRPRQIVFCQGTPVKGLFVVCSGEVKHFSSDRFGRDYIVEFAGAGKLLGDVSCDQKATHSTSAEAVTDSRLCFLENEQLCALLSRCPEAAVDLVAALGHELITTRYKLCDIVLKGAESRLAGLLLDAAHGQEVSEPGRWFRLRRRRREIAAQLGITTETTIRLFGELKRKGAIETDGTNISIADFNRLTRIATRGELR